MPLHKVLAPICQDGREASWPLANTKHGNICWTLHPLHELHASHTLCTDYTHIARTTYIACSQRMIYIAEPKTYRQTRKHSMNMLKPGVAQAHVPHTYLHIYIFTYVTYVTYVVTCMQVCLLMYTGAALHTCEHGKQTVFERHVGLVFGSLAKALDASICAAALLGPNTGMSSSRSLSAKPSASILTCPVVSSRYTRSWLMLKGICHHPFFPG